MKSLDLWYKSCTHMHELYQQSQFLYKQFNFLDNRLIEFMVTPTNEVGRK